MNKTMIKAETISKGNRMYTDYGQTNQYQDYLRQAAREFQDAQYDMHALKQQVGDLCTRVGHTLVVWGQRLQREQPTVAQATVAQRGEESCYPV